MTRSASPASAGNAETLRRVLETERTEIHTSMPGRVRSYDQPAQTAEIELLVRRVVPAADDDDADTVTDYPILPAVPHACLRGSGFFVHMPVRAGDTVAVYFAESDLNEWRRTNAVSDPGVSTRHGLSGAFFVPGIHAIGEALSGADIGTVGPETPAHLTIGVEGGPVIRIKSNAIEIAGTSQLAKSAPLQEHLAKISTDLAALFTALTLGTPSYVFATEIGINPIATTITKGA